MKTIERHLRACGVVQANIVLPRSANHGLYNSLFCLFRFRGAGRASGTGSVEMFDVSRNSLERSARGSERATVFSIATNSYGHYTWSKGCGGARSDVHHVNPD